MSTRSLIETYLARHGLEGEGLTEIVVSAMSNGDVAGADKFVEDMAAAPWFRAIVERWPMLGHEIWASPEIMTAEPDLEEARAILIRDGASREASVFGDVRLGPVDPAVLDWLEGRPWDASASMDMILPTAIDVLRFLGPEAFPENEDRWIEMLQTLASAVRVFGAEGVLHEDGVQPAEMLRIPAMRSILAIAVKGAEPDGLRKLDVRQAGAIVRAAFGPEGSELIDSVDRYFEDRAIKDATYSIPMSIVSPKM